MAPIVCLVYSMRSCTMCRCPEGLILHPIDTHAYSPYTHTQRFEADEQIAASDESAADRYFDEDSSDAVLVKERRKLAEIYEAILESGEKHLTRPNAAKFVGSVGRSGFFAKKKGIKKRIGLENITEILGTALETPDGLFTLDALMAAVFAFRDKTSVTTPGEELFDVELEKELRLSKDAEFQFRVACHVASGEEEFSPDKLVDCVSIHDVDDVFLAMGYTMQEENLAFILARCEVRNMYVLIILMFVMCVCVCACLCGVGWDVCMPLVSVSVSVSVCAVYLY